MILVDSNVIMYAGGSEHPHKAPAVAFLGRVAAGKVEAAIDAETLQEILHRYQSQRRWSGGTAVYAFARSLFPDVLPVTGLVMDIAKKLLDVDPTISGRDAVHAAVVSAYKLDGICTFDRDFDRIRGCKRIKI
jgi:predicted nucleic acid-binding protein